MHSAPVSRYRRIHPAGARRTMTGLIFSFVVLIYIAITLSSFECQQIIIERTGSVFERIITHNTKDPLKIFKLAAPILGWSSFEGDSVFLTPAEYFYWAAGYAGRVNLSSPAAVLQSQIPLLASVEYPGLINGAGIVTTVPQSAAQTATALPGETLVCIYNTHTGETYNLSDGVERLDGRHGGVVTVAEALQEALEKTHGIKCDRSDRINDANYATSYLESEKTARELLAANPNTVMILDIHRDSGQTREQSVVKVNGQEAAAILFIVGSETRRPFPNWRQNHAIAMDLSERLNDMYPGLSQGVRVKDGLYNQSLHPGAVLVEIGTTENSTEEAVLSARLLSDAIAGYIYGTAD